MSTRADKAQKLQKERYHAILRELVQEVPNKTCAECLAKGPRWASWSLGVFMCIRCAGIHRNLGVHISKVKSVDLDSWSTEQIEHILKWGNKRAAEYYECYLPKDFARPQGNHAVDSFIRNKYEKKLYIMNDGEPEPNSSDKLNRLKDVSNSVEKETKPQSSKKRERPDRKHEQKPSNNTILTVTNQKPPPSTVAANQNLTVASAAPHVKSSSMNDLFSLDNPAPHVQTPQHAASSNDLLNFGSFSDPISFQAPDPFSGKPQDLLQTGTGVVNNDLFQSNDTTEIVKSEAAKSTKESILSLYSTGNPNQQKMYGVPGGVYMMQQPGQPQGNNTMFTNQMNQMNTQMQQMSMNNQMRMQQQQQQQGYNQFNMMRPASQSTGGFPQSTSGYMQSNRGFTQPNSNFTQSAGFNGQQNGLQMYAGNMDGMMGNQVNNFSQPNSMVQQRDFNNLVGNNMNNINNRVWPSNNANMMQQQPPLMTGAAMNFDVNSTMGMGTANAGHNMSSGHTMNNQLWN